MNRRRALCALGTGIIGTGLVSCITDPPPTKRVSGSSERRVAPVLVVVAIDGVRWQEVFQGVDAALLARHGGKAGAYRTADDLVPNLTELAFRRGAVMGAPGVGEGFFASGPNFVSLPGYSEMLTGTSDSGCRENSCAGVKRITLLDELSALPDALPEHAAVVSSWPKVERAAAVARGSGVVSAGRRGGYNLHVFENFPRTRITLRRGRDVATKPGGGDYRPDATTSSLAQAFLEEARPRFLFVSLGDTDEYAHQSKYGKYLESLHLADQFVGKVAAILSNFEREGIPTGLFVTTDHGRGEHFVDHGRKWPESARSWLVASGSVIERRGKVPAIGHLADIVPTVRYVMGLPPQTAPSRGRVLNELLSKT